MDELKPALARAVPTPAPGFHILSNEPHLAAWRAKMRIKGAVWWTQRVLNVLFYLFVFSVAGWLLAQYVDKRPPATVQAELMTPVVTPGSELKLKYNIDRHRLCDLTLEWLVFDGINEVRRFSDGKPYPASGKPGVYPTFIRGFWMPNYLHPGPARLRVIRTYDCPDNYVHNFVVTEPDIPFTIRNKNGKSQPVSDQRDAE